MIQDLFAGAPFVSAITKLVSAKGITLEAGSDFSILQSALKSQPERNALQPRFDPHHNDLGETTAFWILGRDAQGEIVHTQAVRTVDLDGLSLAGYMEKSFQEFTPAGYSINLHRSSYHASPGSRAIAGRVCYHGELWIKGGPKGFRGAGMTAVLARLALAMALMKLAPDYVFGFMFPLAACKGLAAREGYVHTEPGSLFWATPARQEDLEAWTVWVSRDDIRHLLGIPPERLFAQLENGQRQSRSDKAA